ncbi:MAG: ThuA domain-containing protein [Verrucomicrobia bacterium]|nr:ThuA domain-containing protein [Verrucomicrobiota bacterium]
MKPTFLRPLLLLLALPLGAWAADKKIVLIAGRPSHPPGAHEHRAGCLLFQKCLAGFPGVKVVVFDNGWPTKPVGGQTVDDHAALDDADAIVIYSDGGVKHPALEGTRLAALGQRVKRGAGFGCIHYAVEPTIENGQAEFLAWMGGAFEINWSVNPHWDGNFKTLPVHAVTRGVKPFTTRDEWYFNMRFRAGLTGVTPILTDVPPPETMNRKDDAHAGNPAVREQVAQRLPQHVMWVAENANGSRGFGFTGGHFHSGWAKDDQRKLVLNAILWLAKVEVPKDGVASTVTEADLAANLDPKNAPAAKKKKQ